VGNLTKNLSRYEFECACQCGCDTLDMKTAEIIQEVCNYFTCRVTINSGHRCEKHNSKVGGGKKSQHLYGRAADCQFHNVPTDIVHKYLTVEYPDKYGFGLYETFNHIDSRTNGPARWGE